MPLSRTPLVCPRMLTVLAFQKHYEEKQKKEGTCNVYCMELQSCIYRGTVIKLTPADLVAYKGPVNYVTHHNVLKPSSSSTLVHLVSNSSFRSSGILCLLVEAWKSFTSRLGALKTIFKTSDNGRIKVPTCQVS